MSGAGLGSRPAFALPFVVLALLACGGGVSPADHADLGARCASRPGYLSTPSIDAQKKLEAHACRRGWLSTSCDPYMDYVIGTCMFEVDGEQRIEIHSSLVTDTDTAREHREAMCDASRLAISMTAHTQVMNGRGNSMTLCGKPRKGR